MSFDIPPDEDEHSECRHEIHRLQERVSELETLLVKEGPLNSERWTLDEVLAELEKWKSVASGKTCVSFECLCFGASSLWHQTHRENFRAIDRNPEALSRWVLARVGKVNGANFPEQVLEILCRLQKENEELKSTVMAQ